jgi:hypothetical protein
MDAVMAGTGSSSKAGGRQRRARAAAIIAASAATALLAASPAGAASSPNPLGVLAQHELLRPTDFPTGWKVTGEPAKSSTPASTGGAATKNLSGVAECEGVSAKGVERNPPSAQAEFARSSGFQFVFETVAVFPSSSVARRVLALFSSSKAPSCVGPVMGKAIASGTSQTGVTTSKISIARLASRGIGSPSTALRLGIPLESNGERAEVVGDVVVIRSQSSVAIMISFGLPGLSQAFVHAIAVKAAQRLR